MKATHIRKKNKAKVFVERYEGNVLVVKNMRGKVLGSYGPMQEHEMKKFFERYEPIKKTAPRRG